MRRIAIFCNVAAAGLLSNCFLVITRGLYIDEGQLMVVYHELDLVKIGNLGVIQTMEKYNNVDAFVRNIFTYKYVVMLESNIEFCPMNAITGPFVKYLKTIAIMSQCH